MLLDLRMLNLAVRDFQILDPEILKPCWAEMLPPQKKKGSGSGCRVIEGFGSRGGLEPILYFPPKLPRESPVQDLGVQSWKTQGKLCCLGRKAPEAHSHRAFHRRIKKTIAWTLNPKP